jgi:hypothetical protein
VLMRSGCFLAHDSLGVLYDGPLAVMTPHGPRHDLALYEILWAAALSIALVTSRLRPGTALLLSYGMLRAATYALRAQPSAVDLVGAAVLLGAGLVAAKRSGMLHAKP